MARAVAAESVEIKEKPVIDECPELNGFQTWLSEFEPWIGGSILATLMSVVLVFALLVLRIFFKF